MRSGSSLTPLTKSTDPTPQLRGIEKRLVTYKRPDGVPLSFTLYLPPGYQAGTRLPTVVWAYPLEFNDADTAGQITGSTQRFTTNVYNQQRIRVRLLQGEVPDISACAMIGDFTITKRLERRRGTEHAYA